MSWLMIALTALAPVQASQVVARICNGSTRPVKFKFYNYTDIAASMQTDELDVAVAFKELVLDPCSCSSDEVMTTSANLNPLLGPVSTELPPKASVQQIVWRPVSGASDRRMTSCISASGTFEGYAEYGTGTFTTAGKACQNARDTATFHEANELTVAVGGLKYVAKAILPNPNTCTDNDLVGCRTYGATYTYSSGNRCNL